MEIPASRSRFMCVSLIGINAIYSIIFFNPTGTFSSEELQEIVSRAIRSSSSESFVRLLGLQNLDHVLPTELQRLESLKGMTQAKYRFLVHRRTMLMQALNSSAVGHTGGDDDGSVPVNSRLTVQLSETTAECDQLVEELMRMADQMAQIHKLIDNHWASALAIALRKVCNFILVHHQFLNYHSNFIFYSLIQAIVDDLWS